jgi:mersacidin/lichenicidin family type 2 lantibiotic
MAPDQIVRAWKDAEYGACLLADGAASVPPHPVGPIDIEDSSLDVAGGSVASTEYLETLGCCQGFTQAGRCDVTAGYPICTMFCFTVFLTAVSLCG